MDRVPLLHRLVRSWVHPETYAVYAKETLGRAIVYWLLFALVGGLLLGGGWSLTLNGWVDELQFQLLRDIPYFEYRDHQLFVDGAMPQTWEDGEESVLIIDTTGQVDPEVMTQYDSGLMLTADCAYRWRYGEWETIDFGRIDGSFTKDEFLTMLPLLKWLSVVLMLGAFLWLLISGMFSALLLALPGLLIRAKGMGFEDLLKLSFYALTLPLLLQAAMGALGITIPYWFWLKHGLAFFLLYLGIRRIKTAAVIAPLIPPTIEQ